MRAVLFAAIVVGFVGGVASVGAEESPAGSWPERVSVYYFGNSLTGSAGFNLHPKVGESAGKKWEVFGSLGPGAPIWAFMNSFMKHGVVVTPS